MISRALFTLVVAVGFQLLSAQEIPSLAVTPSRATVITGDYRPFRAVDRYGQPESTVRWDTGSPNAEVDSQGAEAVVHFDAPGEYVIHAYGTSGTASATVRVFNASRLPEGTVKWSVENLPGCKTGQIVPAIPAAGSTNDVFSTEQCPQGTVIRAFTAEGLENWRTGVPADTLLNASNLKDFQPKSLLGASVCDKLKRGMTKDETAQLVDSAKLKVPLDTSMNVWTFEQTSGECRITFADGVITRKQKIISN